MVFPFLFPFPPTAHPFVYLYSKCEIFDLQFWDKPRKPGKMSIKSTVYMQITYAVLFTSPTNQPTYDLSFSFNVLQSNSHFFCCPAPTSHSLTIYVFYLSLIADAHYDRIIIQFLSQIYSYSHLILCVEFNTWMDLHTTEKGKKIIIVVSTHKKIIAHWVLFGEWWNDNRWNAAAATTKSFICLPT